MLVFIFGTCSLSKRTMNSDTESDEEERKDSAEERNREDPVYGAATAISTSIPKSESSYLVKANVGLDILYWFILILYYIRKGKKY